MYEIVDRDQFARPPDRFTAHHHSIERIINLARIENMSLRTRRSPPPAAASAATNTREPPQLKPKILAAAAAATGSACDSDSERSTGSTTVRNKRKRENDELKDLKTEMRELFSSLSSSVSDRFNEIKQQNTELKSSIQFISDQYDSLLAKLQSMEDERTKDKRAITLLEEKVETLERKMRATGIEIRNVPKISSNSKPETKLEMCSLVKSLGQAVNVKLEESDIRDIYRINSSKDSTKPLIVELNSVIRKETLLSAIKIFNKNKNRNEKLNSTHLNIAGLATPIYVSETLTYKTQKLFFLAREFSRLNGYAYCWTSKGIVHLRKSEGHQLVRINTEADFAKLTSNP